MSNSRRRREILVPQDGVPVNVNLDVMPGHYRDLIRLLCAGVARNKEIAFRMGIQEGTVKVYFRNLYRYLYGRGYDVHDHASVVVWAHNPFAERFQRKAKE